MKRPSLPLVIMILVFLAGPAAAADVCRQHLASSHGISRKVLESSLKREVEEFRTLAERALTLRAETIKVGTAIKHKLDKGKPLTGDDLAMINMGINEHLSLRKELLLVGWTVRKKSWPGRGFLPRRG